MNSTGSSSTSRLHLLVPSLFGTAESGVPRVSALETLLARAEPVSVATQGFETLLFSLRGCHITAAGELPVAAGTRVLDLGIVDNGWSLRADPGHLSPRRDQLILNDSQALDLTQDEASRLVTEIADAYAVDGWTLNAPRP